VDGTLQFNRVNKSLDTRDWARANEIIHEWEGARAVVEEAKSSIPIRQACDAFIADAGARRLAPGSVKKYVLLLINERKEENRDRFSPSLCEFCNAKGIQFTSQLKLDALDRFRGEWKDGAIAAAKKLERLRCFGRFLEDHGWWHKNLAMKLKRPVIKTPPTMPFTTEEITAMLGATANWKDSHKHLNQPNAQQLRTFILFLRYSALRITDATTCDLNRLTGNRLFLYTQKTGVPVHIPLPPFVVEALETCPRKSPRHWFWSGTGAKETASGNWRRAIRRLCKLAGIKDGHPHRFRDTLAVELLLEDVPMERVSILLGHSSIKVTEKHYAPWVHSRQAQLEADLTRVWNKDPLAQKAILQGPPAATNSAVPQPVTLQ
jgi:integrase